MCGIVGYVGKNNSIPILLDGLKQLEYRGYDSAGIAVVIDNKINIIKEKGKIVNLEESIDKNLYSNIGIGHTRWATHGIPSKINSHPHSVGKITLVHNGIIENYQELKEELLKYNYTFKSETDTEIACAYIDYLYSKEKDMLKVLDKIKNIFKGSYAFGIINSDETDTIYATRLDSPLIVATNNEGLFISSDVPAILKHTNKYILLDNYEIVKLNKDINIYKDNKKITKEINSFDFDINSAMKEGYDHYMLKEINEQDKVINNLLNKYNTKELILKNIPDISKYNKIDIVACGSAYHAGLVGKYLIEEFGNTLVNVEIASEYRYKKLFIDEKTLVIVISQSGETADTLACLRIAKKANAKTLGIVNVVGSSIAREVDEVIYINAGVEVAVATTKAYLLQTYILSLIALRLGIDKNILNSKELEIIFNDMNNLPNLIRNTINNDSYKKIAKKIYKKNDIFYLGRNIDYATTMEGSLKLKEISYIHAENYPAGELKHGTISLIEENTPIISVITKKSISEKTISNIKEVKARGSYNVILTNKELDKEYDCYDAKIVIDNIHDLFKPLLNIIPLQLLSYEVAKLRGCDIDKPRNLAKSVTVE